MMVEGVGVPTEMKFIVRMGASNVPTVEAIHRLADEVGVVWDNDPEFLRWTEELTGKKHLDDLTAVERRVVYDALKQGKRPGSV